MYYNACSWKLLLQKQALNDLKTVILREVV